MRVDYRATMPEAIEAMAGLQKVVDNSGLESKLLELVKRRASQINGCAYCLDMHSKDASRSERTSSGCTCWQPGGRLLSRARESEPHLRGARL